MRPPTLIGAIAMLLACATPTSAQEIMMDDTVGVGSEPVESEKFPLVLELKDTAVMVVCR